MVFLMEECKRVHEQLRVEENKLEKDKIQIRVRGEKVSFLLALNRPYLDERVETHDTRCVAIGDAVLAFTVKLFNVKHQMHSIVKAQTVPLVDTQIQQTTATAVNGFRVESRQEVKHNQTIVLKDGHTAKENERLQVELSPHQT